jgi:hypothetical protein
MLARMLARLLFSLTSGCQDCVPACAFLFYHDIPQVKSQGAIPPFHSGPIGVTGGSPVVLIVCLWPSGKRAEAGAKAHGFPETV